MKKKDDIFNALVVFVPIVLMLGICVFGLFMMAKALRLSDMGASSQLFEAGMYISCMSLSVAFACILHLVGEECLSISLFCFFGALVFSYLSSEKNTGSVCLYNISIAAFVLACVLFVIGMIEKTISKSSY